MIAYGLTSKGLDIIFHKFWFCADGLIRCVGDIKRKYVVDWLVVPLMRLVQVGTNLTKDEVTTL
jgi:hypothetical protein